MGTWRLDGEQGQLPGQGEALTQAVGEVSAGPCLAAPVVSVQREQAHRAV